MGDVTREEVEKLIDAFAVKVGFLFEECNATHDQIVADVREFADDERAAVLSLFDAAIRQAREGALEEAAKVVEHGIAHNRIDCTHLIRGLAKGAG